MIWMKCLGLSAQISGVAPVAANRRPQTVARSFPDVDAPMDEGIANSSLDT